MQVAILAGGLATRLGELTSTLPKSLLMVEGKPFIEHQIQFLVAAGITDIVLCTGHLGHQIEEHLGDGTSFGVEIRYSHETVSLGTAGALKNAEPLLRDEFISLYGDSYLFLDFVKAVSYFHSRPEPALMTVYRNAGLYDRSNIVIDGDLIGRYDNVNPDPRTVHIEYGANIFDKTVLAQVPENTFFSLGELFSSLIKQKALLSFEVSDRFYEIGSHQGLADFGEFLRQRKHSAS